MHLRHLSDLQNHGFFCVLANRTSNEIHLILLKMLRTHQKQTVEYHYLFSGLEMSDGRADARAPARRDSSVKAVTPTKQHIALKHCDLMHVAMSRGLGTLSLY